MNDYMAEDEVQEECRPGDLPNWYEDNDNDYIPSDMDDNDQRDILSTKEIIQEENNTLSFKREHVTAMVNMLFSRSMWSGRPVITHTPAYISEIAVVLTILRTTSPLIDENLKIDSSNINKFPEI